MKIIEREPTSRRFRDKSGTVNQHGVKVLRLRGWGVKENGEASNLCVYECECPRCHKTMDVWGNLINRVRHCGCGPLHVRWEQYKFPVTRRYWVAFRKQMARIWKDDYFVFLQDVGEMQPRESLLPLNPTGWERVGPGNFVRYISSSDHPIPRSAPLWVASRSDAEPMLCTLSGLAHLAHISRQAAHQKSPLVVIEQVREIGWNVQALRDWHYQNIGKTLTATFHERPEEEIAQ